MDFYWAITKHLSDSLSSHEIHVSVTSIINGISHKNALLIHECCTEFVNVLHACANTIIGKL